jgi:predicted Ser/Thr protein kinase
LNDDPLGPPSSDSDAFLREVARAPAAATPALEPDLSGQKLGKYQVGARLGAGGMGVVYEAIDTVLQRKVAFKVVARKLAEDDKARARLLREARSLAAVNHPGIAAIYEVAEASGHVFIAMERVPGTTLRALLSEKGKLEPALARKLVADIARALEHAHRAGVVHRDLKPENVMVTPGGETKILDFGLAKASAPEGSGSGDNVTSTVEGHVVGTPSYMSPEQARGQKLDGRSDLFALGAIFYELVTGRRAFSGASLLETLSAIDRDAPTPPRQLSPELSVSLERTILRCLEKKPEARFESASQLVSALESKPPVVELKRGRPALVAAAMVAAALGAAAVYLLRPAPNPLAPARALLACPPLSVVGPPTPNGWLGAAVASAACWRVGVARWTTELPPVVAPAALLGLPQTPSDAIPEDPFSAEDARERAVAEAMKQGAAWLDGEVALKKDIFTIRLELKTPEGKTLAEGEGQHRFMLEALRTAMAPLWGDGKIAVPKALPPEQAELQGSADPMVALALEDLALALEGQSGVEDAAARLAPHRPSLGVVARVVDAAVAYARGEPPPSFEVSLDRSSPARFARSLELALMVGSKVDLAAAADELRDLRLAHASPLMRRALLGTEARLRLGARQNEAVANLVLAGLDEFGFTNEWPTLVTSQMGRPGLGTTARAYAAWRPHTPDTWNILGWRPPAPGDDLGARVGFTERAVTLAPESPLFSTNLGDQYMATGRVADARLLGARLLRNRQTQLAGEVVMLQAESAEGRFRAALDRATRVLASLERFGAIASGDGPLVRLGGEISLILGEPDAFARMAYERFLKPDPPPLDSGPWGVTTLAVTCAHASPEVAGPCGARIQRLLDSGYFTELSPGHQSLIAGAIQFGRRDYARAVAELRKGAVGNYAAGVISVSFDRVGDAATASALDAPLLGNRGYNGATLAVVREARRAAARGDKARARELAQRVVEAWGKADAEVPLLAEMRAIADGRPAPEVTK